MTVRIRKSTSLGNGYSITESYGPKEMLFYLLFIMPYVMMFKIIKFALTCIWKTLPYIWSAIKWTFNKIKSATTKQEPVYSIN